MVQLIQVRTGVWVLDHNTNPMTATFTWSGTADALIAQVEQDIAGEDEQMTATVKAYEMDRVAPVSGALVRKKTEENFSPLHRFDKWTGDETFLVLNNEEEQKVEEWEVLTPAFHGYSYERGCGLSDSGYPGEFIQIVGWNGINAQIRRNNRTSTDLWQSDYVAALTVMVNPETESLEEKVARLERRSRRLEEGLRARMVAHGVYRNWCGEFDPILDSSGLGPRKAKGWVFGALKFRAEVTGDLSDPNFIEKIKAAPSKYITWESIQIETIDAEPAVNAPMLSI